MNDGPDFHDMLGAAIMLEAAEKAICDEARVVGLAKQVLEYDHDRRKKVLAQFMKPFLDSGMAFNAAEVQARALPEFEAAMKKLYREAMDAHIAIEESGAHHATFDAAQSILSALKVAGGKL